MYVRGNKAGTTLIGETTCGTNLTQLCWCSSGDVHGDQLGNVYVSDSSNNRALRYNKCSGSVTVVLGVSESRGSGSTLLAWSRELYVDGNNTLFVFDINNKYGILIVSFHSYFLSLLVECRSAQPMCCDHQCFLYHVRALVLASSSHFRSRWINLPCSEPVFNKLYFSTYS